MPIGHILEKILLPIRYESLVEEVGDQLPTLLVKPGDEIIKILRKIGIIVSTSKQGLFLPFHGAAGMGKTTLVSNLSFYEPMIFGNSLYYSGIIELDRLTRSIDEHRSANPGTTGKIIPIVIDDRENNPPEDDEISSIKKFLRMKDYGTECIILWLMTNKVNAETLSRKYIDIVGKQSIGIPIIYVGVNRGLWVEIAENTVLVVNDLESLDGIGLSFNDELDDTHRTIGDYFRHLATRISAITFEKMYSEVIPIDLNIVIVSESNDQGVLSELTSSSRYGLVSARAVYEATSGSEEGRWWSRRRGQLAEVVMKLNAKLTYMPPTITVSILRRYGSDDIVEKLKKSGLSIKTTSVISEEYSSTTYGKLLLGEEAVIRETRGGHARVSQEKYRIVAKHGLTYGKDKIHNGSIKEAIRQLYLDKAVFVEDVMSEKKLLDKDLIPDIMVKMRDKIIANEYAWRSGNYNVSGNRSEIAAYTLRKLKNYAIKLGWAEP